MNPVRLRCVCVAGRCMALAWLVVMSAGCSLTRPAPVKDMFLLEPPLPTATAKPHAVSVRMGQVTVAAPYRDRPFVYRTGEVKYESDFYNEFFVTPAAMIAQATGRALAHANVFARVVPAGNALDDGQYVLEGFVNELYADARMKPAAGVIGVQYYLIRTGAASSIAWSGNYRERVVLREPTAEALATAWNEAFGRVLGTLVRDLAAIELER